MQLTHIALWTNHLERLRDFYVKYFNGKSNEKYVNPKKGFASYFVSFESGPALEIMQRQDITEANGISSMLPPISVTPACERNFFMADWVKLSFAFWRDMARPAPCEAEHNDSSTPRPATR